MNSRQIILLNVFAIILVLALTITPTDSIPPVSPQIQSLVRNKRQTACKDNEPCKWEVYDIKSGMYQYDIQNENCKCLKMCTKAEDDISIGAFVYRCRPAS